MDDNGWEQWKRLVLEKLDRHENWLVSIDKRIGKLREDIGKDISKLREDIVILKLKAGAWGLAGGLIPVLIAGLVAYMRAGP